MEKEISNLELEEVENKLKGIDFLIKSLVYMNNCDEELFTNGIMAISDNINAVIKKLSKEESIK